MAKSAHDIGYTDLVHAVEQKLTYMRKAYPGLVASQKMNEWWATHDIACFEAIVKLLKKHQKDPQLNLQDLFEKPKKHG